MHKNKFMDQIVSLNDCLEAKWKNIEVKDLHIVFIDLEIAYDMWWVLKNKEEFLLSILSSLRIFKVRDQVGHEISFLGLMVGYVQEKFILMRANSLYYKQ